MTEPPPARPGDAAPTQDVIDRALTAVLRDERGADGRLTELGEAAFRRVMALYNTPAHRLPPVVARALRPSREAADQWSTAVATVAVANPELFLAGMGDEISILDAVLLGRIDRRAAVPHLVRAADSPEWLLRYHAVRSLRLYESDPAAASALARARADAEQIIREAAGGGADTGC